MGFQHLTHWRGPKSSRDLLIPPPGRGSLVLIFSHFFFEVSYILCVGVLCLHAVSAEARRGRWFPWSRSYRWPRAAKWVLGPLEEQPRHFIVDPSFQSRCQEARGLEALT